MSLRLQWLGASTHLVEPGAPKTTREVPLTPLETQNNGSERQGAASHLLLALLMGSAEEGVQAVLNQIQSQSQLSPQTRERAHTHTHIDGAGTTPIPIK